MTKYILHDESYDSFEVFDKEPTSEEIDDFISNHSEDPNYTTVYEVKKVGDIKRQHIIIFDDKCKDC